MKQQTKQTPLETLLVDKERIRQQSRQQELKLNAAFTYVSENVGSLLLSGVSSILFSGSGKSKTNKALTSSGYIQTDDAQSTSFGLSDYLSIGKMMIPVIWEITKPVIIAWGIKKVKKIIAQAFKNSSL